MPKGAKPEKRQRNITSPASAGSLARLRMPRTGRTGRRHGAYRRLAEQALVAGQAVGVVDPGLNRLGVAGTEGEAQLDRVGDVAALGRVGGGGTAGPGQAVARERGHG